MPGGLLGIISSRTGFFLAQSANWRERVVLRLYRPLLLADFGMGVLDAMVETAAYVIRSLVRDEDRQLTLQLVKDLKQVPIGKNSIFSTKKYEETRGLKRHQANGELRRLFDGGFIKPVEGSFPRWMRQEANIFKAPASTNTQYPSLICLRLLGIDDKERALREALCNHDSSSRFVVEPEKFCQIPNSPFCYWVSNKVRELFIDMPPLEGKDQTVLVGLQTDDDFRFVRAWWEIEPSQIAENVGQTYDGKTWLHLLKGGGASAFYSDVSVVVNWAKNGMSIKEWISIALNGGHWSRHAFNTEWYCHEGLSWAVRTKRFMPSLVPRGCIPTVSRYLLTCRADYWKLLGVLNCSLATYLLRLSNERFEHPKYLVGHVQRLPLPNLEIETENNIGSIAVRMYNIKRALDTVNEVSHVFYLPSLLQMKGDRLLERCIAWHSSVNDAKQQLDSYQNEIDDITFRLYNINDVDRHTIIESIANPTPYDIGDEQREEEEADEGQSLADQRQLTADLISYTLGCSFGRWDIRYATGERAAPELPDPFSPLPVLSPCALQCKNRLPLMESPPGYPLHIDGEGVLVDDPGHDNDIIRLLQDVFGLLWGERAEVIERETCEQLSVKDLREYFRRLTTEGFWQDHIKRYAKSKRKAPIYWLLQSSKKNYSLWLYYHRLDKDILFKALLNYVEPKLRLEENKLEQIRAEHTNAGTSGREVKQLEKQIDRQEAFLSELRDFHDKLECAAKLGLEPDLNDGVVLNIAPLWELVPWAEAKKYWEELKAGKYEWSTISKQMREKGLIT